MAVINAIVYIKGRSKTSQAVTGFVHDMIPGIKKQLNFKGDTSITLGYFEST